MIIKEANESLFDSTADTLICPVNCEGVMGRGLALPFKERCGGLFENYRAFCKAGQLEPGLLYLWVPVEGPKVLCFPTKVRWMNPSKKEYLEAGLKTLVAHYKEMGIKRIAIPPLGCGNGQMDYLRCVRPLLLKYLSDIDLEVELLTF